MQGIAGGVKAKLLFIEIALPFYWQPESGWPKATVRQLRATSSAGMGCFAAVALRNNPMHESIYPNAYA
jgi:hypothetical protein